ncbi:MAG TPA: hypothetical protein VM144_16980 [Aestuariivirga sp.]|nr:hypothetical protein [Aestuariivirga sp.]
MAKPPKQRMAESRRRERLRLSRVYLDVNVDLLAALVMNKLPESEWSDPEKLESEAAAELNDIAAKVLLQRHSQLPPEIANVAEVNRGTKMFGRLSNKSNISPTPEVLEAALSGVRKSPELIEAEEKLASLRARHAQVYDKIRNLNATIGRQVDAHMESQREREVGKLTEERINLEAEMRGLKALRNDLTWPWKIAVGEAARPALQAQARELLDHLRAIERLGASFQNTAIKFPDALGAMIPLNSPGNRHWMEFAQKLAGEETLQ